MTIRNIGKASPLLGHTYVINLDIKGIHASVDEHSSVTGWSYFVSWSIGKYHIHLRLLDKQRFFLPLRAMTEEQIVELRAMLTDKIGPMGVVRKVAK